MDIIGPKICPKHAKQARFMCTKTSCFEDKDILVCPQCSTRHVGHQSDLIQTNLLNQKVHQLMKKRMDFQQIYEKACDDMINQLKKFKLFKIQILNILNHKEKILNQLCKKIKRNIPYQKDRNLFKKTLNYIYLSMKGINPNMQLYKKFNLAVKQTLTQCRSSLYKLQINLMPINLFEKKDHQICSILKKTGENSINQIKFEQPKFKQFKKQTLKFSKQQQQIQANSFLFRLSNEQFLAYNEKCHYLKWYNTNCFLVPRSLYIGHGIQHLTVLGKSIFLTQKEGKITIFDILNQKIIKQYASSNHKSAQIVNVLSLDSENVLNFVTSPNQIVALKFTQQTQQLKMIKGIETNARCTSSSILGDQFVSCFQDKTIGIYKTDILQKQRQYSLDYTMRSIATIDQNTFIVGGQQKKMILYDKRAVGLVLNIPCSQNIYSLKKIYPNSILFSMPNYLKIFDLRVQKELFSNKIEQNAISLQILSSDSFVTSGKNIHHWKGIL